MNAADGKLKVLTITEGFVKLWLEVKVVGALWKHFDINIISSQEYQVRLLYFTFSTMSSLCGGHYICSLWTAMMGVRGKRQMCSDSVL